MTDLTIDGEMFRVEVEGDPARPPLLLSSSLGSDLSMWDAQMPALLAHFRVVRYDPRGHGRSTTAGAPYSLARLGADVLAILDALKIERTHFLGLSMGGAVGQWLLVNAPERIDRAVLANTNARFAPPQLWNERIRTVRTKGMQALAAATMERWFSDGFRTDHADKVAAMDKVFRATVGEGYLGAAAALRDTDMREALRAIDRPVLVVTGRDDGIASAADIATILGAIPGVRHVELDCKHISNIEAQAAFDAAVVGFLTGPLRAGKPKAKTAAKPATRRRPGPAARSPLKRPQAAATPERRRPATGSTRTRPKPAPAKASPRKTARPAAPHRVSPVAARAPVATTKAKKGPVGKAAPAKSPTREAKAAVKVTAKAAPRRAAAASVATKKAVAKKAVAKKAIAKKAVITRTATKKATPKKVAAKKVGKTAAKKIVAKPAARRPTAKRPARPAGRGRR